MIKSLRRGWVPADANMTDIYNGAVRIYRCSDTGELLTTTATNRVIMWPILDHDEWDKFTVIPVKFIEYDKIPAYTMAEIERIEEQYYPKSEIPQLVSPDQIQQEILAAQAEAAMYPSLIPAEETKPKKKKNSIHINITNTATNTAPKPKKSTPATAMVVPVPPDPIPSAPPMPSLPPAVVQTMIHHAIMTNATCPLTDVFIKDQQPHMIAVTSCGHVFYKPAIKKWIFRDPTCPCCQTYCQVHE